MSSKNTTQHETILKLVNKGWTNRAIAAQFDPPISGERVRQIRNALGMPTAREVSRERVKPMCQRCGKARTFKGRKLCSSCRTTADKRGLTEAQMLKVPVRKINAHTNCQSCGVKFGTKVKRGFDARHSNYGHGLCGTCYRRIRYQSDPKVRAQRAESSKRYLDRVRKDPEKLARLREQNRKRGATFRAKKLKQSKS